MKGAEIISAVIAETRLCERDFFGSRSLQPVRARRIAIKRLQAAGLSNAEIGRAVRRSAAAIRYWVCSEARDRDLARRHRALALFRQSAEASV